MARLGVEAALVDGALVRGDVEVADGRIAAVGVNGRPGKGIAAPGFVDLQVNGFAGVDFFSADRAGYERAGEAILRTGVTAYQPTFITSPETELEAALHELPQDGDGAPAPHVLGAHLEGPFLAPQRLGSHPVAARRDPDVELLQRLLGAGRVTHVTLAPELPGALELVDLLRRRGVTVACGHSDATADEARAAFRRADDTAKLVWNVASGRVALVTDAVAAARLGDGTFRLGGVEVEVTNGVARRAGVLAGSTVTMIESIRNLVQLGASLEAALSAATEVPARIIGRDDVGRLRLGARADVVVLDDNVEIVRVVAAGEDALD